MHRIISSRKLLLLTIAATIVYSLLVALVPTRLLMEILNALFIGIVGAVTIVFFPLFLRSIRLKKFDRVSQLTMGIILTWVSLIINRTLSIYINATDNDVRAMLAPAIAFAAYVAILGGILHISAPGMVEDHWKYNKGVLFLGIVFGVILAGTAIYLQQSGLPVPLSK